MIFLRLFYEFFKVGLFAVGGGMATLPFLQDMGEVTGWFTSMDLMNILAVSESTPGPIGINMASYVGFTTAGVPGAVVATLGEVAPSILIILIIARLLKSFRDNRYVEMAFYGLRPASTGLIAASCVTVILTNLFRAEIKAKSGALLASFSWAGSVNWKGLLLVGVLFCLTDWIKPTRNLHPIVFIGFSAVVGIVFRFGGV